MIDTIIINGTKVENASKNSSTGIGKSFRRNKVILIIPKIERKVSMTIAQRITSIITSLDVLQH